MAIISARNVSKIYGKKSNAFTALSGVNLDIKKGESLAIIGKSGSGKSTLMHILAQLDRPTSGVLAVGGRDVKKLKTRQLDRLRNREFGFVFQQFFMNANDSVLHNVALPLKIAGVGKRTRNRRSVEVLNAVGLSDKARSRARDLSGGQKQRLCIARAIVGEPKIIFADEPTGNLDSATGKVIEDLLFDLNKKRGITLIVVTHDEDLARRCDRQIRIKDGQIEGDAYLAPNEPRAKLTPKRSAK